MIALYNRSNDCKPYNVEAKLAKHRAAYGQHVDFDRFDLAANYPDGYSDGLTTWCILSSKTVLKQQSKQNSSNAFGQNII